MAEAETADLRWPLPEDWDDGQIERKRNPHRPASAVWRKHDEPDWPAIHRELQTHNNLTLQLVWVEYRITCPEGYGYSRFCDLYRQWLGKRDLVLRQEHRDGDTIPIHDPATGAVKRAAIFVSVLGTSSYTYAEATAGQDLASWIGSHIRAFEFYGGVARLTVPDNLKSGVTKPCYYEPELNRTYAKMGEHYGTAILPARPYRPRDKAKVEAGVQVVQRWIVAALRKRKFFSLAELNPAIAELLTKLNQRPFRKRDGSRASLFAQLDRPALQPLPATRYEFGEWKVARVNLDYHVEVYRHFYSVPHALAHSQVEVHATATTIEIFHRGVRVPSHVRSQEAAKATTIIEHMPKAHQKHASQTPSRLINEAGLTGPTTAALVDAILAAKRHPEIGYRACLGILRLARQYPAERMEAAAARALGTRAYSFQSLESILKNNLDRIPLPSPSTAALQAAVDHENIRGADYYSSPADPEPPAIP